MDDQSCENEPSRTVVRDPKAEREAQIAYLSARPRPNQGGKPSQEAAITEVVSKLETMHITSIAWSDLVFGQLADEDQNCRVYDGTLHYTEVTITEWLLTSDSDDEGAPPEGVYEEFINIVRFMSDLRSPYTVMLIGYTVNLTANRLAFVNENVGTRLQGFLYGLDVKRPSRKDRLKILAGVAKGLCYLHARNIQYRNLKSYSILVESPSFRPKLSDFSLAALPESRAAGLSNARYHPPELLLGRSGTLASDVYSMGVIIHETLTGRKPVGTFNARGLCAPPSPPLDARTATPELIRIVEECFNTIPERRPLMARVTEVIEAALRSAWADTSMDEDEVNTPLSPTPKSPAAVTPSPSGATSPQATIRTEPGTPEVERRGNTTVGDTPRGAGAAAAGGATLTRTLTAATVGETAAKALAGITVEEHLVHKFEQALIPWEEIFVGEEIGEGAFGRVIMGEYFSAPVAIKILKPMVGRDAGAMIRQFVEEASVLQKVNYLHIVRLMGVSIGEQRYGIVMEFATGGDLGTWLRTEAGQAAHRSTRLSVLTDVCKGLSYLHKKGVVHRDIKPANILLDKNINPAKLADFGISGLTSDHVGGGTPRYMAPEVIIGDPCTEPSDIFSFGVVIWEVIARQVPYPHVKVDANGHVDRGDLTKPPGPRTGDERIDGLLAQALNFNASTRPTAASLLQLLIMCQ